MRRLLAFCFVLLWCGLAFGQTRWIEPGSYSQPFAPRLATPAASAETLATPSLTLDTPSPVAGATNRTTSAAIDSGVHFNQPVWYAPGVQFDRPLFLDSSIAPAQVQVNFLDAAVAHQERTFESGAATYESSYGAAQLKETSTGRKAGRVFTNSDIARLNDLNGLIKYSGKLAHLN